MTNLKAAEGLFQGFADGDDDSVRALCSTDFQAVQNGGAPQNLERVLAFSAAVKSVVEGFRYENAVRSATANGFVEEHDVCGTLPDGTQLRLFVCVVAEMNGAKITHLREYFDSAQAAALVAHLTAA